MTKVMTYFTFFLAVGAALFVLYRFSNSVYKFYLSPNYWSEVEGVVLEIGVESHDNSSTNSTGHISHDAAYIPKPKYEFWVGSEKYINDTYQSGFSHSFQTKEEVMNLFIKGQNVKVYYNKDNPNESVLTLEQKTSSIPMLLIFEAFLIFIAFFISRKIF